MEHRYTVGEVQKRTGIPASALRFYDDIGLVKPSYTDENTGYRYYGYTEFWQLEIVKICKGMGIPLKELKKVLESNDPAKFVALMMKEQESAAKKLENMQKMVNDLTWMTTRYEKAGEWTPGNWEIRHFPKRYILSVDAEEEQDSDSLHFKLQCKAEDALSRRSSIQREYGYELAQDDFLKGNIRWEKEFLVVEEAEYKQESYTEILEEGDYFCFMCQPFAEEKAWYRIWNQVKENCADRSMARIIAMEAALYFYDWRDEVYEIQILLK